VTEFGGSGVTLMTTNVVAELSLNVSKRGEGHEDFGAFRRGDRPCRRVNK